MVKIYGRLNEEDRKRLEKGVMLEGKNTAPAKIKNVKFNRNFTEFTITIHEGKKRQIRKMLKKVGHHVTELKRLSVGPLQLGQMKAGQWRSLKQKEIQSIKK